MSSSVTFHRTHFFYVTYVTIGHIFLLLLPGIWGHRNHSLITFNNIPALQISDYRESGKPLRGLAYCFVFQVYHFTSSKKVRANRIPQSSSVGRFSFLQIHTWVAYLLVVLGSMQNLCYCFPQGIGPVLCFQHPQAQTSRCSQTESRLRSCLSLSIITAPNLTQ